MLRIVRKIIVLLFVFLFFFVNRTSALGFNIQDHQYGIVFLKIPSGEATLIFNSQFEGILINCGSTSSQKVILKSLDKFQIKRISHLYISSYKPLYAGNIDGIKEQFENVKVHDISIAEQNTIYGIPGFEQLEIEKIPSPFSKGDDFYLRYKQFSIYFQGDSSNRELQLFLKSKYVTTTNIVKVGNFGSEDSFTKELIDKMNPQYAVIFDDPNHVPNYSLLKKFYDAWVDLYLLEDSGSFGVITDGVNFQPFVLD